MSALDDLRAAYEREAGKRWAASRLIEALESALEERDDHIRFLEAETQHLAMMERLGADMATAIGWDTEGEGWIEKAANAAHRWRDVEAENERLEALLAAHRAVIRSLYAHVINPRQTTTVARMDWPRAECSALLDALGDSAKEVKP